MNTTDTTQRDALLALKELRDTGDVSDWQAMEAALDLAIEALAAPAAGAARTEDHSFPATSRRERAVATLLAEGWKWDGREWSRPAAGAHPEKRLAFAGTALLDEQIDAATNAGYLRLLSKVLCDAGFSKLAAPLPVIAASYDQLTDEASTTGGIAAAAGQGEARIPSAAEWCADNAIEVPMNWRAGWDACRVEFPRTPLAEKVQGVVAWVCWDPPCSEAPEIYFQTENPYPNGDENGNSWSPLYTTPPAPSAVAVDEALARRFLDALTEERGTYEHEQPITLDEVMVALTAAPGSAGGVEGGGDDVRAALAECYEWLFESKADGPRVSEGALTNGSYTREFHALHEQVTAALAQPRAERQEDSNG